MIKPGIALFLMTSKGLAVLEHIIKCGFADMISHVVIGEDKQILNDYSIEIKAMCEQHSIKCSSRKNLLEIDSEYGIAISWRWLIDSEKLKLIVLHDSILPRYRGFAPLVNQLINGEKQIGVSALFASAEYDRGEIISQEIVNVSYPITIQQAIDIINPAYALLVGKILFNLRDTGKLESFPQNEMKATYSLWRDEEDYNINWHQSASDIKRFIDAVGYPYKGAAAILDGAIVRILCAEEYSDVQIENRIPGKVIFMNNGHPVIVCGTGLLKIIEGTNPDGTQLLPLKKFRSKFQ